MVKKNWGFIVTVLIFILQTLWGLVCGIITNYVSDAAKGEPWNRAWIQSPIWTLWKRVAFSIFLLLLCYLLHFLVFACSPKRYCFTFRREWIGIVLMLCPALFFVFIWFNRSELQWPIIVLIALSGFWLFMEGLAQMIPYMGSPAFRLIRFLYKKSNRLTRFSHEQ